MSFRKFIKTAAPLNHPSGSQKFTLKWKVGAKFMRPIDYINGGKILTVREIRNNYKVYAVEDGRWTDIYKCTLVG